ncbi:MAG: hypothetical protein R3E79_14700 [Caldilineaceae bacterium]
MPTRGRRWPTFVLPWPIRLKLMPLPSFASPSELPGSWSYIGTDALGVPANEPTMNLGWLTRGTPNDEVQRVCSMNLVMRWG